MLTVDAMMMRDFSDADRTTGEQSEAVKAAEQARLRQEESDRRRGRFASPAELRRRLAELEAVETKRVEELRLAFVAAEAALADCEYLRLKRAVQAARNDYSLASMQLDRKRDQLNGYLRESEKANPTPIQRVTSMLGLNDDER